MSDSNKYVIFVNKPKKVVIKRGRKMIKKTKTEEQEKFERKEQIKKRQQRENILKNICDKEEYLELEGKKFIYPNQQEAADKCIEAYKNGAVAVCLIAQPGTGKTGTAQAVMIHMTTNPNDEEIIYSENIINCTGMSDNDWEQQFKDSVLPAFKDNIFHRQNLIKQKDKLMKLKDGLLQIDECHIASGSKMSIAKILKEAGILDLNVLEMRNIKMLDISATPDAVLHDYEKWGNKCAIIKIKPGPSYKGFEVMLNEKRIIDVPNLEDLKDYYELLEFLDERYKNSTKKFFPFRLLDQVKINILQNVCDDKDWNYLNHNSNERIDEIDTIMKNPPTKHTIIFIKGFWRASKRLLMKHVGATYEPIPRIRNVSVTAQALPARFCDNYEYSGDQLDINLRPLHYCDKGAIEQYVEWFNNDCDFSVSKYKSNRISSNGKGKVNAKPTKVNSKIVSGINDDKNQIKEPTIKKFDTQEEAKEYYNKALKDKMKGRGPTKIKQNENGYYEATIRSKKKIYTCDEITCEKRQGLTENNYRLYPCYEDVNDKSTLKWWFIHY
tara:strand:+ start:180 stop:1838 length:1659 start_codon:yes stop_codon:yes gene_type:complete